MSKAIPTTAAAVAAEIAAKKQRKKEKHQIDADLLLMDDGLADSDTSSMIVDKEEELRRRIDEVLVAFDQRGDKTIDSADLAHIFRCMHLNVTQADILEIEAQVFKYNSN